MNKSNQSVKTNQSLGLMDVVVGVCYTICVLASIYQVETNRDH